jgi:EH domain-containing protein 1
VIIHPGTIFFGWFTEGKMFSWMSKDEGRKKTHEVYDGVAEGLKGIYRQKLLPLEKEYQFHDFHSPALDDPDFDAK